MQRKPSNEQETTPAQTKNTNTMTAACAKLLSPKSSVFVARARGVCAAFCLLSSCSFHHTLFSENEPSINPPAAPARRTDQGQQSRSTKSQGEIDYRSSNAPWTRNDEGTLYKARASALAVAFQRPGDAGTKASDMGTVDCAC